MKKRRSKHPTNEYRIISEDMFDIVEDPSVVSEIPSIIKNMNAHEPEQEENFD
jgi:hypothetical protein